VAANARKRKDGWDRQKGQIIGGQGISVLIHHCGQGKGKADQPPTANNIMVRRDLDSDGKRLASKSYRPDKPWSM
jgi:hypothetical protein